MIGSLLAVLLLSTATSLEVRVPGAAGTLGGTLTLPVRGRPPFPAVVTLTGSGAHYGDGNRTPEHPYRPFRQIAETLAGCGVATLRLDDRGVGESTGDASAATAEDTAADAEAARTFRATMRYQHRYRIEKDGTIAAADREAALAQAMIQQDANVKASTEAWRRSIQ